MIMIATVLRLGSGNMLVRDSSTGNEVLVHFSGASAFRPGDVVQITFNGIMTQSIPPQITATSVARVNQPQPSPSPSPSQTVINRATILQIRRGALLVRDPGNNRQVVVNYPYAHHFCVGQRVNVSYDTITLSNPPQVNATDIAPVC